MQRRVLFAVAVGLFAIVGLVAAGAVLYDDGRSSTPTNVTVYADGERVATIAAEVADTGGERYVGLSEHDSLADDEGMLFVYDRARSDLTYVMRNMDFGIDIVYVDGSGCVTSVHPAPLDGDYRHPGSGQYVLEVPLGVLSDAGVERGDAVRFEYGNTTVDGRDHACVGAEDNVILYNGSERVAAIDATIADTSAERFTGLSNHDSLAEDRGMLFVYDEEQSLTFVMREMDFAIDIVYVDSRGCVTGVDPARPPGPNEDGNDLRHPGEGQYVIEVVRGVASENGVERGDPVRIEYGDTVVDGTDADCFES